MKKILSVLLTLALFISIIPSITFAEDLTILYLDFNSSLPSWAGVSGNIAYEDGIVNDCVVFDGESYITLPSDITKGIENFTISFWARFDSITPNVWQRIFDFGNIDGSSAYLGTWQWAGSNNVRSGIMGSQLTNFDVYQLGEWAHYAVTQNGDTQTFYINGREVASATCETRLKDFNCSQNYIGYYNKNTEPTEGFHGALDEFLFTQAVLSSDEINQMAFVGLNDEKKVESLERRIYLNKNGEKFDYFTFDDGVNSVTWKSSHPDILTVDGLHSSKKDLTDITLTAIIKAGKNQKEIDYQFVAGEFDGKVTFMETTLEKIAVDTIRKTSIDIDTNKTYFIKSKGKYLSETDGKLTMLDQSNETALWRFAKSPKTNNTYAIFNVASGKCFDVENHSTEKGANVIMYSGGKDMNQLWYVVKENTKYALIGYQSEWFLNDDFTLHSLDDYTLWDIEETENTLIQFGKELKEEQSKYASLSDNAYYTLKCDNGYLAAGDNGVEFSTKPYLQKAQWLITHIDGNYYTIINKKTGKNLNISGNNTNAGASVILWQGAAGNNEQFNFERTPIGFIISSKDNKNFLSFTNSLTMEKKPSFWTLQKMSDAPEKVIETGNTSNLLTAYIPTVTEEINSSTGFIHPGILITKEDITRMQKKVREGAEPWASSFEKLANDGFSNKTVRIYAHDSNGDTTALKSEARLKNMRMDSRAVVNQALMYVITGDEVYRQNAMTILRMWSHLRDVYTTLGSDRIDHGEIAFKLAFAAELMKYTSCENPSLVWTEEDNANFTKMLETTLPKYNSWWYWMNQHGICNLGTMANAIFCNDLSLYKESVERTTVNKRGGGSIDYTKGSGGSITQVFRIVDFDSLNGDKISPTFVHAEMGRDQGHAYGCLGSLSLCAQMLHTQNTKVDPITGEYSDKENAVTVFNFADDRLLQAGTYMGRYNLGYDVMHPTIDIGGYYNDINDVNRGALYVAFGILYNHYKYEEKVNMNDEKYRYVKEAHEYHYPEGGQNDFYIGYSDLLFTPEDAQIDLKQFERIGDGGRVWQAEYYTALNKGKAEKCDGYAKIFLNENGTQIALTNGSYAPSSKNQVLLKVKSTSDVKVVMQNEHTAYAPFVTGIIPSTNGEWKEIAFNIQSEGIIRQRLFFLTFYGEGEIDIDYMSLIE